jgi:Peptidase inhibitor family I36
MRVLVMAISLAFVTSSQVGAVEEGQPFRGIQVMPGAVIQGDLIVYENGRVVVVPASGAGFDDCLAGYICLFENTNWTGSIIQFSDCCVWYDLGDFGFNNRASSWRNRKTVDGQIAMGAGGSGSKLCLDNNSYASSMPTGWDNAASSFRVRNAGTYC